jgi:hypothetical protein
LEKKYKKKKEECTLDYCCNPQYIVWGNSDSSTPFRVLFEKYKKNRKTMWENTAAIHSILKKKNYKVKFLIMSIFKK